MHKMVAVEFQLKWEIRRLSRTKRFMAGFHWETKHEKYTGGMKYVPISTFIKSEMFSSSFFPTAAEGLAFMKTSKAERVRSDPVGDK
jgi:hypothetical protein